MIPKNKRSNDQLEVAPSAALGAHRGDTGVSHRKEHQGLMTLIRSCSDGASIERIHHA